MENRKYKVCRDNIYVGEVALTNKIYRYEGNSNFFLTKKGELTTGSWCSYRSMLFVLDEDKLSDDLLYRSPSYPVLNVTDDKFCLDLNGNNNIVIKEACNLAALLKYFEYDEVLTFKDIMRIKNTFFTGKFAKDNCELFGWKETMAEDVIFYSDGEKVTDLKKLKRLRWEFRTGQLLGHRTFSKTSDELLPKKYFDVLDDRGDNTLLEAICLRESMNAFMPHKQEGPIKKLRRL